MRTWLYCGVLSCRPRVCYYIGNCWRDVRGRGLPALRRGHMVCTDALQRAARLTVKNAGRPRAGPRSTHTAHG